jgi:pyrimidine deaminase RibD-like protein
VAENPTVGAVVVSGATVGNQDDVVKFGESVSEIISSESQKVIAENCTTFVVGEGVEVFWKGKKGKRWSY